MTLLKLVHVGAAVVSICGFILRAILAIRNSPLLRHRLLRIGPHVVDTVLLGSAVGLLFSIQQYPFVHTWLTAKVIALLLYIGLGFFVLRFGRSPAQRAITSLIAVMVFAYIMAVAITHDPWMGLVR